MQYEFVKYLFLASIFRKVKFNFLEPDADLFNTLRGHTQTMWTIFWPFLTPPPPMWT